jgi:invasion protein IalB
MRLGKPVIETLQNLLNAQRRIDRMCYFLGVLFTAMLASPGLAGAESETGVKYEDWTRRCEKVGDTEKEICHISQNLVLRESSQRLLNMAVGYLKPDTAENVRAVITLPLGIYLAPGISVRIDKGKTRQFPIERCNKNGCIVVFTMSPELVAAMKGGLQALITFHDAKRQAIGVPVSLKGFTAGLNSLR